MSKITNVRLPNANAATFDPQQFNQLVRSLEQIILQLNSTYTPVTTEDKDQAQSWFLSGASLGLGNLTVSSITAGAVNLGAWAIEPSGTKLLFKYNGISVGSLDSTGNLTVTGNVTGFGAP
jgi:hypothetical protein